MMADFERVDWGLIADSVIGEFRFIDDRRLFWVSEVRKSAQLFLFGLA
jgi:hypothetical protein